MLFSVIVPIYNVEAYLSRCLESILANRFQDYELILVNDGSTDGCGGICDAFASRDERVRVIHKPNGGLVSARNAGIRQARGAYILYVDGDDWVSPDWMSTIEKKLTEAPVMPDVVVFDAERVYADHIEPCVSALPAGFYDRERLESQVFPRLLIDRRRAYGEGIIHPTAWNKAYRNELLQEHHCMDEGIRLAEDNAFAFECCFCARSMVICRQVLYHYNKTNPTSIRGKVDPDRYKKLRRTLQYVTERLRPYTRWTEGQMNDYYASRIIIEVIDTCRKYPALFQAAGHMATELKETRLTDFVRLGGLPFRAGTLMLLLRLRCFPAAAAGARLLIRMKKRGLA